MMECKKALAETGGDQEAAVEQLRKQGLKTQETRLGRETSAGRIAVFADVPGKVGAMIELLCESAPVANSPEFKQFANDLAKQLGHGSRRSHRRRAAQAAVARQSRVKRSATVKDDMFNRIREVFKVGRIVRFDGPSGGYAHHDGSIGALVEVSGGNDEVGQRRSPCTSRRRSRRSCRRKHLDPAEIDTEREILSVAARTEGKPENIIAKMVEGRLRNFFSEKVLLEQPFVKDDKQTVGQIAKKAGLTIKRFVRWELGKE